MARHVGKGFTVHLTASLRAGTKALKELRSQGHISTTNWYKLEVEPIDNNGNYSGAHRTLTFTLENELRVEVEVSTWKRRLGDVVDGDGGREWRSYVVWIEGHGKMKCLVNNVGNKLWFRQHESDKPLPGTTWRPPTPVEIAAYKTAVQNNDEGAFLKVYYADLIAWEELNDSLGRNTNWFRTTLQKTP